MPSIVRFGAGAGAGAGAGSTSVAAMPIIVFFAGASAGGVARVVGVGVGAGAGAANSIIVRFGAEAGSVAGPTSNTAPHPPQNFAVGGFSYAQCGHRCSDISAAHYISGLATSA